jgi:hypothetical protein
MNIIKFLGLSILMIQLISCSHDCGIGSVDLENIDDFVDCYLAKHKNNDLPLIGQENLLHLAARLQASQVSINKIVEAGVDVNGFTTMPKHTPLHSAALTGNLETISAIIENGGDVSTTNSMGNTPYEVFKYNCPKTNMSDSDIQKILNLLKGDLGQVSE